MWRRYGSPKSLCQTCGLCLFVLVALTYALRGRHWQGHCGRCVVLLCDTRLWVLWSGAPSFCAMTRDCPDRGQGARSAPHPQAGAHGGTGYWADTEQPSPVTVPERVLLWEPELDRFDRTWLIVPDVRLRTGGLQHIGISVLTPTSMLLFVGAGIYYWRRARRGWVLGPHMCRVCGYNLTGNVSGICPECGTPIPPSPEAKRRESS